MKNILVLPAGGNVGFEVSKILLEEKKHKVFLATRNIEKAKKTFADFSNANYRFFDFEDFSSFQNTFENIDIVFLLRPPHIADVPKYFYPLVNAFEKQGLVKIIFLSVFGAQTKKFIPHFKIESLIKKRGFEYVFVRPSYFMQNITSNLLGDIKEFDKIILPAKDNKFNWIDAKDIAFSVSKIIDNFEKHKNSAFEITGSQNLNFYEVAQIMSEILDKNISYEYLSILKFFLLKRKQGIKIPLILIMIALHFPSSKNKIESNDFYNLTNQNPRTLQDFLSEKKDKFII